VAILVTFVLYLALQILANGTIVASLGGVDPRVATIVGGGIVVAYTTIGGLRADIRTDVFQFCVMLIIIFVLVPGVFIKGGGFSALCELPASFLSGRDFAPYPVIAMAFLFIGAMVLTSADTWQRAFAADSAANAKWAMKITSILVLCFSATAVFLGVYGKIIMPGVNPDNVVAALIKLTLPAGIYGLVVAGLFATIMSSADTVLLVTSMTIVHDFYQKFCRTQPSPEKVLRLSRIITVILGVLAIGWALFVFSIVKLSFHSVSFFAAILPAIVFGFHAKRASEGAAFWSIVSGLITIFVFLFIAPVEAFIPGLLVSFLVFGIVQWAANSRTKG
jgi:SSS family solute:Na+ symporter